MDQTSFWGGSPKTMFYMGLFLGLAVSAIAALAIVLSMVWNGGAVGAKVAVNNPPIVADPQPSALPPAGPVPEVSSNDHVIGNKNAKVTLIEYSDFECPFCKRHFPSVKQALTDFPNDVRLVYRHYPLSFHPNAQKAAEASECAAKLGGNDAFWKMHDKIFALEAMSIDAYVKAAKEIGLNEGNFKKCVDSGEMAGRVASDASGGDTAGVTGTPATFVNGSLISGAVPYTELKAAIQAAGGSK